MRRLLKISSSICIISALLLLLNLLDTITFPTALYRTCGVTCLISMFIMAYTRVWLISYRRKASRK